MFATTKPQTRKDEIIALFAEGKVDDALFQELKEINAAEQQAKVEREGEIVNIVTAIGELGKHGNPLTFAELMSHQYEGKPLFASTEVMDYARGHGWKMPGTVVINSRSNEGTRTRKSAAEKEKEGMLLFTVHQPGAKGSPTRIFKGEKFPQKIQAKLVWLFQQEGDLKKNLMALATDSAEVKEYLASDEGKAEVKKWVDYISENAPKMLEPAHPAEADNKKTNNKNRKK